MSFLSAIVTAIVSKAKNKLKGGKGKSKTIKKSLIAFIITAFLGISLIGGAVYSVTGAISEFFNGLFKMFNTSDTSKIDYDKISDEQLQKLVDETGASITAKKIAEYIKIEKDSVPSSKKGTKKVVNNNGSKDTTKDTEINLDLSSYVNKYKVNWEFVAAVDLARFTADDDNDKTVINNASSIYPVFDWSDAKRVETETWKSWDEEYEVDLSTGKKKEIKNTKKDAKEQYTKTTTPLAIPNKVTTMFGDYIYSLNKDVVVQDIPYCTPFIESQEVTERKEVVGEEDDKNKPIYKEDKSKPSYQNVPIYVDSKRIVSYGVEMNTCNRTAYLNSTDKKRNIYTKPQTSASVLTKVDSNVTLKVLAIGDYFMKVELPNGKIGYTYWNWFYVSNEIPIRYEKKLVGYSKKLVGYEKKKIYTTIRTYKNKMTTVKLKTTENQVGSIKMDFDPTVFIKYINGCDLSVNDLDLVRECLISIPNGSNIVENIDRIISGDYGDIEDGMSSDNSSDGANGSMAGVLPLYIQWDERWGSVSYAGSTIAKAGCGPTTMAMVVTGMMGNVKPFDTNGDGVADPKEMAKWATSKKYASNGEGSYNTIVSGSCAAAGLSCKETNNYQEVIQALKNGKVVVDNVAPNKVLNSGHHFLVLTGLDSEGKILLNDPNSKENSDKGWDGSEIHKITKTYWIVDNPSLNSQKKFIMKIRQGAVETQKKHGVYASVTIAQAIHESGWGTSKLSSSDNNLFGVKFPGKHDPSLKIAQGTWATDDGGYYTHYDSWGDSVQDHGYFLKNNSIYAAAGVFNAKDGYEQIKCIKKAGYASDTDYVKKVTKFIDDYKLYLYDGQAKS